MTPNQSHVAGLELARRMVEQNFHIGDEAMVIRLDTMIAQAKAATAEPFQKPTLLKECSVRYSDSSGGVCRSEYKGGPEQTAEPTEAVEVVAHMWQHDETGRVGFVDQQQVDWGFEKNNPRLHLCGELMTVAQHKRLMAAKDGDVVKVPRELLCRWECELDQIPKAFHISDEMAALLGGAG